MPLDLSGTEDPWVVVNTHPHREHFALENLERRNFRVYCPLIRKRHSHARRVTEVLRPLFPNYVFVQISPMLQRWRPILSTYGVRTLVRFGAELSTIDHGFIESLKAREIDGAVARPAIPYQIGQAVQMAGGPFDSIVGTIIAMDAKDRLVVLLEFMNRVVKVQVESARVSPA